MPYTINTLTLAVGNGDADKIDDCLLEDVDVNAQDDSGWLPLDWLTKTPREKRPLIAETLLAFNADPLQPNGRGGTPLTEILKKGDINILEKFLIKIKQNAVDKNLSLADITIEVKEQTFPLLFFLIPFGETAVKTFVLQLDGDLLWLQSSHQGKTPFLYALYKRCTDVALYLLSEGAQPNEKDANSVSAIQYLVRYESKEKIKNFLEEHSIEVNNIDNNTQSCIHHLCSSIKSQSNVLDLFIDYPEVDFNLQDISNDTPLMVALKKLATFQQSMGLNENTDSEGEATNSTEDRLHNNQIKKILKLLSLGVKVSIPNNEYKEAYDLAEELPLKKDLVNIIYKHSLIETLEKKFSLLRTKIADPYLKNNLPSINKLIKYKYKINAGLEEDIESEVQVISTHLKTVLKSIEKKPFFDYSVVKLYETIKILLIDDHEFKLKIFDRFDKKYLPENISNKDYYYTFLNNKTYRLTKEKEGTINYHLMTTLTYEASRHDWDDEICQLHHHLICKVNTKYTHYTLKDYQKALPKIEEEKETYFGENISDDSDSDEEKRYQALPHRKKSMTMAYTQILFKRAQPDELLTKKEHALKKGNRLPDYDRSARQHIYREDSSVSDRVQRDLERLNMLAITEELNEETLQTVSTPFYVAQYRGIGYRINQGSKIQRKIHRQLKEESQPQFSHAVIAAGGYRSFDSYYEKKSETKAEDNKLLAIAERMQDKLLQLASSGPVRIDWNGAPYDYDNALHALQDLYSKCYDKFHTALKTFVKKLNIQGDAPIPIETLKDTIINSINSQFNPIVSTSDTPEHALRYAYGDKYYEKYKKFRLRPRWRKDGRCERPYSGKVYISLHQPLELHHKSHHVVSLNEMGKVHIDLLTIPERETSFFAYIPPKRVVSQHVAKFPSFKGKYKEIYFEKYGLNLELYEKFQEAMQDSKPHSKERKDITRLLTAHLVSYQEVCLIEEAQIAARKLDPTAILIYRNEYGGYSLHPCQPKENVRVLNKKHQLAAATGNELKNKRRKIRKEGGFAQEDKGTDSESFLSSLLSKYTLFAPKPTSLTNRLATLLDISIAELEKLKSGINSNQPVIDFFTRSKPNSINRQFHMYYEFLKYVAEKYSIHIHLHSPELKDQYKIIKNDDQNRREIHIYYAGGDQFSILQPKEEAPSPTLSMMSIA